MKEHSIYYAVLERAIFILFVSFFNYIHTVLRDGAESLGNKCKGAERQGADPNVKLSTLQIVELSNCRCYKMSNLFGL
jgi:hypothetical protein